MRLAREGDPQECVRLHPLTDQLRQGYLVSPSVRVSIRKYRPVFIMGMVRRVGSHPYSRPSSGTIKDIEQRPQAAFKKAVLEPATQLSSLETVLVLVSFKPARLESP